MKQGRQIHYGPRDREGLLDLHVFGFYWRERGETRIRNRGAANSETNPDDSTKRPVWLGIRECKFLGAPSACHSSVGYVCMPNKAYPQLGFSPTSLPYLHLRILHGTLVFERVASLWLTDGDFME